MDIIQSTLCWLSASLILYYLWDFVITKRLACRNAKHPLIGGYWWTSRVVLNFFFAAKATQLLQEGYEKFKTGTFQLIRGAGSMVILPHSTLEELSLLPNSIASGNLALEHDLLGPYTGLDMILEHRIHHSIVQRKLTPRLPLLAPALHAELNSAFEERIPPAEDWTDIQPFLDFGFGVARIASRAIVGPAFCRNPAWINIAVNYTQDLFETIVIMPKGLLGPKFAVLIRRNDEGTWSPGETEEEFNVLSWMVEAAKGSDRNPEALAHAEVLLALASVHTILVRVVNVMYDLMSHPEYIEELREEIDHIQKATSWDNPAQAYSQLHKLDSVIRESQRLSPPTILGMKRMFNQDYTFSTGLTIEKGTYAAIPVMAIENDPENTLNPSEYDGYRSYRKAQAAKEAGQKWSDYQFTSIDETTLNFGYGKTACPGRFFASLTVKMMMVKLLTDYDWRFKAGVDRPKNHLVHEFLFPWPWDKVQIRRREKPACPF
ncbi:cytochrome P450 [Penicillium malachiteum]|uniref:Cytochrome P450 n=1 Tax=Penicillium malachiteum TaxID=1324776 RepID=A0AAD6HLK1_9EURO|nr:cytochrome P450 [Penicillium malachiteum]